jgi:hypothetical protein
MTVCYWDSCSRLPLTLRLYNRRRCAARRKAIRFYLENLKQARTKCDELRLPTTLDRCPGEIRCLPKIPFETIHITGL